MTKIVLKMLFALWVIQVQNKATVFV